ncbi:MAG: hypothetical protein IJ584_06635 [Bacteroidales bacterium]|nr:hypothetical protein [Bacteroidales bacterium]MBR1434768.1 hypothetical protein [Bacteroidales bacterium]
MVQSPEEGKVLSYGMTGEDGSFAAGYVFPGDSVDVIASSMTIEQYSVRIPVSQSYLEIRVNPDIRTLREVKVIAPKMEQKGDTLNYNVSSFADASDRSIGDILKKLPGIDVNSSGKIFYQGLEISNFYVEGMDLLQGRYSIATSNIDASKVATVQVLENHQPIKVLEGMDIPETAAINLKLRSSALGAFFVTAQAGIGVPSLLLANELLGMRFSSNQQNLIMYKGDNTGRDILREMTSFYGASSSPVMEVFSLEGGSAPAIDLQHYLFNDAHVFSVNDLRTLGKDLTLTSNVNFLLDRQEGEMGYEQTILAGSGGDPLVIAESVNTGTRKKELSATVTLEKNTADAYLRNRTDLRSVWDSGKVNVLSEQDISQTITRPSVCFENSFRRIKGNNTLTSSALFSDQNHSMTVSPLLLEPFSAFYGSATQDFSARQFKLDAGYRRTVRLSRFLTCYFGGTAFVSDYAVTSGIMMGDSGDHYQAENLLNDLDRSEAGASLSARMILSRDRWHFNLNVPLEMRLVRVNDHIMKENAGRRPYLLPNPSLSWEYRINAPLLLRFDSMYRRSISGVRDDLSGYVMTSYRSFSRSAGELPISDILLLQTTLSVKDPSSATMAYLMYSYSRNWRNTLSALNYSGVLCSMTSVPYHNAGDSHSVSLDFGSAVSAISTTFGVVALAGKSRSVSLYQGEVADYMTEMLRIRPSVTTSLFHGSAILKWDASWSVSSSTVSGTRFTPVKYLRQTFSLSMVPLKGGSVTLTGNHYYNSALQPDPSVLFGSLSLRYKLKKTEFLLDWTNFLNTRQLASFSYDDISSYRTSYLLRPSELLLRIRFTIL